MINPLHYIQNGIISCLAQGSSDECFQFLEVQFSKVYDNNRS